MNCKGVIAENDRLRGELGKIIDVANSFGWNGVDNSKILRVFLEDRLSEGDRLRDKLDAISDAFPDSATHKHPETGESLLDNVRDLVRDHERDQRGSDVVLRCHQCNGTVLYKRAGNEYLFYHSCWSEQQRETLAAKDREILALQEGQEKLRRELAEARKDSERFAWWFSPVSSKLRLELCLKEVESWKWDLDKWRVEIDAAMKGGQDA